MNRYILAIDQSTSSTKALLFDAAGERAGRFDIPHRQIVNEKGWVEHDPEEIFKNLIGAIKGLIDETGVEKSAIIGAAISNQRETSIVWNKTNGRPFYNAIVWQCGRGEGICSEIREAGGANIVKRSTGLNLSPYFSAAKMAWVLKNVPEALMAQQKGELCCSTVDSWLVYKLTGGREIKTDYSNASRTQLMNITCLCWDNEICSLFGVNPASLPEICDSDALFGHTDFEGMFEKKIPIHALMGDSHAALFGQGCLEKGMIKATYGTGSSVMMNIGQKPVLSDQIVTSLAWGLHGRVDYVLEGNLNYTGAVIKWLVDDLGLINSSKEAGELAQKARRVEGLYLVPAFSGLGAPYWDGKARALICGMDRGCTRNEIVRAAEECIAYQITDILRLMQKEAGLELKTLRVDGGATRDGFLMQFQADIADLEIIPAPIEELSGMGVAYAAGIALGLYDSKTVFSRQAGAKYSPNMDKRERDSLYSGWLEAVKLSLSR